MVPTVRRILAHLNLIPPLSLASQREVQDSCFNDYKDQWKKTHSNHTSKRSSSFQENSISKNHRKTTRIQNSSNNHTGPMHLLSLKSAPTTSTVGPSSPHSISVSQLPQPLIFSRLDTKSLTPHQLHLPQCLANQIQIQTQTQTQIQTVPLLMYGKGDTGSRELKTNNIECNSTIK